MSYSYYLMHGLTLQACALLMASLPPFLPGAGIYFITISCGFITTWIISSKLFLCVEKPSSFTRKSLLAAAQSAARRAAHA
jgi:peptidoglycan/LPS O-acetylase OafA/YrhL